MQRKNRDQFVALLRKASLLQHPAYEALSYAWGDSNITKSIQLNGLPFEVTTNLWWALRYMRRSNRSQVIWVDAVCINQSDLEEKVSQLRLMGMIYRQAQMVRVWLGVPDDADRHAMNVLRALAGLKILKLSPDVLDGLDDGSATEHILMMSKGYEARQHLRQFVQRSWWKRIWVVQEVALGRTVHFQLGHDVLFFETLEKACDSAKAFFRKRTRGLTPDFYDNFAHHTVQDLESVALLSEVRKSYEASFRHKQASQVANIDGLIWMGIVNRFRQRDATVPVDKLYGLYALLPNWMAQHASMAPSYLISTEEAFINTTYGMIEASKSLMIVGMLSTRDSGSELLPSWVPDWRLPAYSTDDYLIRVAQSVLYRASGEHSLSLQRLSANTLCLQGFFLDMINVAAGHAIEPSTGFILNHVHGMWRDVWHQDPTFHALQLNGAEEQAENEFRLAMAQGLFPGRRWQGIPQISLFRAATPENNGGSGA